MTRIKYKELDGVVLEAEIMQFGVTIDLKEMYYSIIDVNSHSLIVKKTVIKSRSHAMKEVKSKLKELGVQFSDEVRKKKHTTTVCSLTGISENDISN